MDKSTEANDFLNLPRDETNLLCTVFSGLFFSLLHDSEYGGSRAQRDELDWTAAGGEHLDSAANAPRRDYREQHRLSGQRYAPPAAVRYRSAGVVGRLDDRNGPAARHTGVE